MTSVQPVKGTRDFYPEEMTFRRWLYSCIKKVSESFGYQEYEAPILERLELYAAKSGEELVSEQSYIFKDRGGEMVVLRPELTLSLARMVAMRIKSLPKPIRWWSYGPFWRYERPQRGRTREFFQWNIDLLGIDTPQADAELVAVVAAFFRELGLGPDKVRILVNNRRLADHLLQTIGIPLNRRVEIFRLIDRKEKMSESAWRAYASEQGLNQEQSDQLELVLSNHQAWQSWDELSRFFEACEALGISDFVSYEPTIIRGLDYYTGTVFEARDVTGEERAILGGGRYDNLVSDVGGDPLPGVGFAMGDVVIQLVLEKYGVIPKIRVHPADVLVATFDDTTINAALSLASKLREQGLKAEWYPIPERLPKQFKYADRQEIPIVALIGPDEIANNTATVKDLRKGTQETLQRDAVGAYIRRLLEID